MHFSIVITGFLSSPFIGALSFIIALILQSNSTFKQLSLKVYIMKIGRIRLELLAFLSFFGG